MSNWKIADLWIRATLIFSYSIHDWVDARRYLTLFCRDQNSVVLKTEDQANLEVSEDQGNRKVVLEVVEASLYWLTPV